MEKNFNEWIENKDPELIPLQETSTRYSVEVNYRTTFEEAIESYAKLCLSYVSAGMKNCEYHVKTIFNEKPFRVIVSTRNWDDGEWVGIVAFNHKEHCFIIADGHYNKDRKTVSIQSNKKCSGKSASEITKELRNHMEKLKKQKPRGSDTLEPAKLKRGPKPQFLKKFKPLTGPWKPK
jgi:hypothetical protein